MSGTESERRQAGHEARRDVLSHTTQPGAGVRYDALLRYLRGLYVRAPRERNVTQESPKAQEPAKAQEPRTEPTEE